MTNPADLSDARLTTRGGLRYKLLKQSLQVEIGGATMTEVYRMRAVDVDDFVLESFPIPGELNGIFQPAWRRSCPGCNYLITKTVNVDTPTDQLPTDIWGYDSGAPDGTYDDQVLVTINYETLTHTQEDFDPADPETFLKHSINAGGEYLVIPPKNLSGEETGAVKDFNAPITKMIPTIEHTLDWSFVYLPPWTAIRAQLGTVNDAVLKMFNNAPAESVLFVSLSGEQTYTTAGAKPWSLSYKFSERLVRDGTQSVGWNYCYLPSKAKWERIYRRDPTTGDLLALYEPTDFFDLFKAELV